MNGGLISAVRFPRSRNTGMRPWGVAFYDRKKYQDAGLEIRFQKMILDEYPQKGDPFEPGLSIIDVMMFNDVDRIRQMMDHYELI